jgi:glutamate dehydrogenase
MLNLAPDDADTPAIEQLKVVFLAALGAGDHGPTSEQTAFLAHVLDDLRQGELADLTEEDLGMALAGFWRSRRLPAEEKLSIRYERAFGADGRALDLDRLEIIQPDSPFLVDSVMGQIAEAGAHVQAMVHPIVEVDGRRLSMIQVWLAPLGGDRQGSLIERLRAALADTRAAVIDFTLMLTLLRRCTAELQEAAPGHHDDVAEAVEFLRWVDAGHFVFLGAREYQYPRSPEGDYLAEEPSYQPEGSLGVLRDQSLRVLRRASASQLIRP